MNDNDIMLFILKRMIDKSGLAESVVQKTNGRDALAYCRDLISDPDLLTAYPRIIFLDLHMPVMNGWQFMDEFTTDILPHFPETKVVITSQSVDNQDMVRTRQYPFVIDFLGSAITLEYLEQLGKRLVG